LGRSSDGIHWEFEEEPLALCNGAGQPQPVQFAYDPRVVLIEDTYYVIWCTDFCADFPQPTLGLAKTKDFKTFTRLDNICLPFNRNGVLFPEKIGGNFVLLSRPSDDGHTPFGDIFLSESPDLVYWGKHRHVMSRVPGAWQSLKIGGGAAPIRTSEGWLLIYHGVVQTCSGYVYSMGAAILDAQNPAIVRRRCRNYILTPELWYEERGFVPNVVFPCAALCDAATGRIAIYYGAADSYVGLAFTTAQELIRYIKENDLRG
jgi:beta-1,4-mannooligosaccharide/beta-1,4-mannosyl-N-acetylglucosamine phosphorylase